MQRHGTEIPTIYEFPILAIVEALGTATLRDIAPRIRSSSTAAKQAAWRLTQRGLLAHSEAGSTVVHPTANLIALMLESV